MIYISLSIALLLILVVFYLKKKLRPYGAIGKNVILPQLSRFLTSESAQKLLWWFGRLMNKKYIDIPMENKDKVKVALAFICADDPHSYMLLQSLALMQDQYPLFVRIIVLMPGLKTWATEANTQIHWAVNDSKSLAELYALKAPVLDSERQNQDSFQSCTAELLSECKPIKVSSSSEGEAFSRRRLSRCITILEKIWGEYGTINVSSPTLSATQQAELSSNDKLLRRVGYYGPGVVEVEGEIYLVSRLHHLERRLRNIPVTDGTKDDSLLFGKELERLGRIIPFPPNLQLPSSSTLLTNPCAHVILYYSFRSPYSQLAVTRLRHICAYYNAVLSIRVLMPMVMRGLPVPFAKAKFIVFDCARDARLWRLNFGFLCDPINPEGKPVMRALDTYMTARQRGAEFEFIQAFSEMQWGAGYCAGTDEGLKSIVDRVGSDRLPWTEVQEALGKTVVESAWRKLTERNRTVVYEGGLWGVPCVSVQTIEGNGMYNGLLDTDCDLPAVGVREQAVVKSIPYCGDKTFVWGQDKLWLVERELIRSKKL